MKRLRPIDLWPYDYAREQPTPWLWVSEGITDYYADLAVARSGLVDSLGFFELIAGKITHVANTRPVALARRVGEHVDPSGGRHRRHLL